ncbi:MAG TPA: alkaline phosphatase family protein, partial [Candidatus Nitrosotalea sp.]|nr:alkaline phosphatase family protein [Candidatus Nitrosotalea sp.]
MPGSRPSRYVRPLAFLIALAAGGCGGGSGSSPSGPLPPPPPPTRGKYFTHVVVIVQENRTFDNLFATFPGADGTTVGKTHNGKLRLHKANLESPISPNNGYTYWQHDYNNGKMNGFDTQPPGTYVYQYVDPAQIKPYWELAQQYVLADHNFQTQGSGSFTAHQDLIRGGTDIGGSQSLIDFPNGQPWGCDAPSGTRTSLISLGNQYQHLQGPYPCLTYETLRDLLDNAGVSWRYYTPSTGGFAGNLWNAFEAIKAVRLGSEWHTNVASPETQIFTDIRHGRLASVSWVIPDYANSDHPGDNSDTGPSWVAQITNAIGESPLWDTTAILVVWDDWGG